jgi:hypothetical protein
VFLGSDGAREFAKAAEDVGFAHDPSTPNRRIHNPHAEREILTLKEGGRSALVQSGLSHECWPLAVSHFATSRTAFEKSPQYPKQTRIQAATGAAFAGEAIPFGALVHYRPSNLRDLGAFSARAVPGIFVGWLLGPGLKFSGEYRALDYNALLNQLPSRRTPQLIKELVLPQNEQWQFPLADARRRSLLEFARSHELPSIADIPFESVLENSPDLPLEKQVRQTPVTLERRILFGRTDGCKGCHENVRSHTSECHQRFKVLVEEKARKDEQDSKSKG